MPQYTCTGFSQLHIDVARFATDDFNPFHDPRKWQRLRHNPFQGPIVLGFQIAAWLVEQVAEFRCRHDDPELLGELPFHNYQLRFAAALKPGQAFRLLIKPSRYDEEKGELANRVLLKSQGGLLVVGQCSRSRKALLEADPDVPGDLCRQPDRSDLSGGWFLKRKFMMSANGKNFLLGSRVEPSRYFDELENRICFPPLFPVSYVSCALLERARKHHHDFEAEPMVYTRHEVSLDLRVAGRIRSNDRLHLLVRPEWESADEHRFLCLGRIENRPLFTTRISLVPLTRIVEALRR